MKEYVLLLPLIFIFHDMEEIIGFGWFFRNNPGIFERFPPIAKVYRGFTTEGMALAVYEEFIPFFGISILAYFIQNAILNAVWFGLLISLTGHFAVHIGQSLYIRKYIPSLITSVICLPLCILLIKQSAECISFDIATSAVIAASIPLMVANLKFAHWLMHRYGKKLAGTKLT